MKRFITILLILALAFVVIGCKRSSGGLTIRDGVLMIGMDIGYPPMEYFGPDGITPIGFDVDMSKALAAKMGLEPQFVNTDWDGIFDGVTTNRYDVIISSVTITPARQNVHNFTHPYIANTLSMVLLKNSSITARNPEQLAGLNVTYQRATTADFYMKELAARTGMRYSSFEYDQVLRCFDELRFNRVDVIITDALVAFDYTSSDDSPFEIVWLGSDDPEVFGMCLRKGNDALTDALNKALTELFNDGTMLRISNNIFGMDLVSQARQQW